MKGFRIVAVAAAVAVYLQIVLGAVVRITGSGLGCPDWPACQGQLVPNFADSHVVIEYAHRLVGSAAGILMLATAAVAILLYTRRGDRTAGGMPRGLAVTAAVGVLLIVLQGVLGGVTVLTGNTPFTVAIHLGNALLVLAAALVVALWAGRELGSTSGRRASVAPAGRASPAQSGLVFAAVSAAFVIVLSGAYVVGAGAGAACPGWPLCGSGGRTGFTDIHMLHRVVVLFGSAVILAAAWQGSRRWRGGPMGATAYLTAAILIAEAAVGAAQALLGLPAPLRAVHVALATLVWTGAVLMAGALWLETRPQISRAANPSSALAGAGAKP